MNLKGKKLLMLGGASYAPYLRQYADSKGFSLFALGNQPNKAMQLYTKDFFIAEATDAAQVSEVIRREGINGIIAIGNENIINTAIDVAKECNIPFFIEREHWDNLQDKQNFKALCKKFGIDTVEEYSVSTETSDSELKKLPYPIVLKPADSCGSMGITICFDFQSVKDAMAKALKFSRSSRFIAEQYMQKPEFIVSYIIADGKASIWMLGDRHMNTSQRGFGGISNLSVFPSRYAKLYCDTVNEKMLKLLEQHGPKNGTMFVQAFVDGERIRFFDPGLRFCGTLDTILYEPICGINPLHWMVNHALTGVMDDEGEIEKMDWKLKGKHAAQLSVHVRPGCLKEIKGLSELRKIPNVIQLIQHLDAGDTVTMAGTLQQVLARVYFTVDNRGDILETVNTVYEKLSVLDEKGEEMIMPFVLDYSI